MNKIIKLLLKTRLLGNSRGDNASLSMDRTPLKRMICSSFPRLNRLGKKQKKNDEAVNLVENCVIGDGHTWSED